MQNLWCPQFLSQPVHAQNNGESCFFLLSMHCCILLCRQCRAKYYIGIMVSISWLTAETASFARDVCFRKFNNMWNGGVAKESTSSGTQSSDNSLAPTDIYSKTEVLNLWMQQSRSSVKKQSFGVTRLPWQLHAITKTVGNYQIRTFIQHLFITHTVRVPSILVTAFVLAFIMGQITPACLTVLGQCELQLWQASFQLTSCLHVLLFLSLKES